VQNRFCLEARGCRGEGESGEQEGEMVQTMYAHVNKGIKKKRIKIEKRSNECFVSPTEHNTPDPNFLSVCLSVCLSILCLF
jgi:hypothetical protein